MTVVSYLLAWYIVIGSGWARQLGKKTLRWNFTWALIVIVPGYLLYIHSLIFTPPKRVLGRRNEFGKILKANTIGLLIFGLVLYFGRKEPHLFNFSQRLVVYFYGINVLMITAERNAIRMVLRSMRTRGYNQKHILLVGYSGAAEGFVDRVRSNPQWGYNIRGILDDNRERGSQYDGVKIIGTIDDLGISWSRTPWMRSPLPPSLGEYEKLRRIVALCEKAGVHTKFIPDYGNIIPTIPYMEDLQGSSDHPYPPCALKQPSQCHGEAGGGYFRLPGGNHPVFPIMLVTAIAIKLTSPGPIIFCQERVGLHNRPFKMQVPFHDRPGSRQGKKSRWTTPGDSRVTTVGKIIRRTSIDETPQFFNILMGDMSLVGPRPERPFFVEKFKEEIPRYMIKHQVRPGLTGWAQVNGYRGDTSIVKG